MNRLRPALVGLVAAVVVLLLAPACSVADPPALTFDDWTLTRSQLMDELNALNESPQVASALGLTPSGTPQGGLAGGSTTTSPSIPTTDSATLLNTHVQFRMILQVAERLGVPEPSADEVTTVRASAEESLQGATVPPELSDLFSEAVTYAAIRPAVLDALLADVDLTAEARVIYDDGIASGEITEQICLDAVVKAPDSFLQGGQPTPAEIAASRADMEAVRTELVAGGDFAAAAAQSDDPQVAEQQGDIGCVAPEQLEQNPQVAEAALTTEVGEISEVIDLDGGFLVLRVRSRGVPTFEELQDAIEQNLQSQLPDTKLAEALQAEARTASVEVDPLFGRWDAEQGQVLTPEGATRPPVTIREIGEDEIMVPQTLPAELTPAP